MPACPPGTRARGSWGARTRSRGSRPCSTTRPPVEPGAMLLGGTAGVGITRFLDEAIAPRRRAERADDRPPRRRDAGRDGRAVRTARARPRAGARRAPGRRAGAGRRAGGRGARPAAARRSRARLEAGRLVVDGIRPGAPERRQARTTRGRPRDARAARGAPPGRAHPRGPPPRRRRRPAPSSRSSPASPPTSGWRSSRPTSPTSIPRDDPWVAAVATIAAAPRPPERLTLPPLGRDELAALIEGIEGERPSASLLLLVAERSGGSPLVAEELLAARRELPTVSLTGSLDDLVVGRLGIRSLECRRVLRLLAPAGRPLRPGAAGRIAAELRDRRRRARRRGRAARRAAAAASSTRTSPPGSPRPSSTGSSSSATAPSGSATS